MPEKPNPDGLFPRAEELVDIRDISVDPSLAKNERIAEFLRQIQNPFLYRCGKFTVRARYSQNGMSLEDCLKQILL